VDDVFWMAPIKVPSARFRANADSSVCKSSTTTPSLLWCSRHCGVHKKGADRSRRWKEKPRRSGDAPGLVWF
jgi:hypothetical protein